jgi:Ras-related protein Rab-1A
MIYTTLYKILIVGNANAGKTAILDRFTNKSFNDSYISTIGIDFNVKSVSINDNVSIKLQIWDTCGQERFKALTRSYYRNANAVIVVYDITSPQSFKNAKEWIKETEQYLDDDVLVILVGNKSDLYEFRKVQYFEGHQLAEQKRLQFFETSAKYDNNIETVFDFVAQKLYDTDKKKKENDSIPLKKSWRKRHCFC